MNRSRNWLGWLVATAAWLTGCSEEEEPPAPRACLSAEDCAEGERCRGNACEVPLGCTPGADECGVLTCSPQTGTCEVCGGVPTTCDFSVCQPGERQCGDFTRVQICDAYGRSWVDEAQCGDGQVCSGGACTDAMCPPNTTYCKDDNIYRCVDGTYERIDRQCVDEELNDSACNPATVECEMLACNRPGETYCDGDVFHCDESRFMVTVLEDCPDELPCDPETLACPEQP